AGGCHVLLQHQFGGARSLRTQESLQKWRNLFPCCSLTDEEPRHSSDHDENRRDREQRVVRKRSPETRGTVCRPIRVGPREHVDQPLRMHAVNRWELVPHTEPALGPDGKRLTVVQLCGSM